MYACKWKRIELVKWLVNLCDDYHIEIEDGKIKSWKIHNNLQKLYDKMI